MLKWAANRGLHVDDGPVIEEDLCMDHASSATFGGHVADNTKNDDPYTHAGPVSVAAHGSK